MKQETETDTTVLQRFDEEPAEAPVKAVPQSELRQDIVTGDWVIIATGRAKRPTDFAHIERAPHDGPDLFADPVASGQEKDVLMYGDEENWSLRVFPNKFPALSRGKLPRETGEGPYFALTGTGYHEVIVTRDPVRPIPLLEEWRVAELMDAYQERYLDLMKKKSVKYIQIFHNHGREAGASIGHPHSQLLATPVISPYTRGELDGAEQYFRKNKQSPYTVMLEYELATKKRLIFENERFVAFAPYASRVAFETWVMPKQASPYFERITDDDKFAVAEVMKRALGALYDGLNDPPFNFYLHTAPCDGREYPHYRWHFEILPHTSTWAGFELSTGIEITTVTPEAAAAYLREKLQAKEE